MSIDIFGRRLAGSRVRVGTRGPPGVGFKTTADNQYDMDGKQLCNIADPRQLNDAVNLKTVQKAIEASQGPLRESMDALGKKLNENIERQKDVDRAIYNSLVSTLEFLKSLDVRLAEIEHRRKVHSTQFEKTRLEMRIENTDRIGRLEVAMQREVKPFTMHGKS